MSRSNTRSRPSPADAVPVLPRQTADPAALASEEGFRADPARVWAWYAERRAGVREPAAKGFRTVAGAPAPTTLRPPRLLLPLG